MRCLRSAPARRRTLAQPVRATHPGGRAKLGLPSPRETRSMSCHRLIACAFALVLSAPALAQSTDVLRKVVGNRTSENVPDIPAELLERLNRYQNTRGASVAGWTREGCVLVSTRFADTAQAHRVCEPLGMREQLTFYPEPVSGVTPAPEESRADGFVFGKDKGGDEFSQLYWFDTRTRATSLLTD